MSTLLPILRQAKPEKGMHRPEALLALPDAPTSLHGTPRAIVGSCGVGGHVSLSDAMNAKAAALAIPLNAHFTITDRCHMRCVHCYLHHRKEAELNTQEALHVLDELANAGTLNLTLTGGEPFVRPDLYELLQRATELRFAMRLFTTAMHIDDVWADRLAELGIFRVEVSVYSGIAADHDAVTKLAGSWERTIAGVRRLRERGIAVTLKTPVMRFNFESYRTLFPLCEELGCTPRFDASVTVMEDGDHATLEQRLTPQELMQVQNDALLFPDISRHRAGDRVKPGKDEGFLKESPCSAGHSGVAVSARGEVLSCIEMQIVAGSLREHSFQEIWNGEVFRRIRALKNKDVAGCNSCSLFRHCNRCPGQALREDGFIDGPSTDACLRTTARAALMQKLG